MIESGMNCPKCNSSINSEDEFCTECGEIFLEEIKCKNHPDVNANGVCIICCEAYCNHCLGSLDKMYLCIQHSNYEIYQGMARVHGTNSEAEAKYAEECLKQEGLHPFVYIRKMNPLSLGGIDYSLFRAAGEYDGHIINEIKLMVPCQEVIQAEIILKDLEFE
jgi:hypothetical protein